MGKSEKIAVIPARGGSKRIPEKNLALFRGRPLVAHTIEQSLAADIFDRILLSTDDERIAAVGRAYPVEILPRSEQLADDRATILQVLCDIIDHLALAPATTIGMLQVTAPLRSVDDIRNAYRLFCDHDGACAIVSVAVNLYPIQLAWRIDKDHHLVPALGEAAGTIRKQDQQPTYYWNDAVLFDSARNFSGPRPNLFGDRPIPYVMPAERSVPIDYPIQLEICRCLGEK